MAAERLQNKPCGGRYGDIVQAIGHTPIVELKRMSPKPGVRIWAKMESVNPTGSVKDRVARAMIEDAEERGLIGPGQTILEPTSGNTGISLAMICRRKGYPLKVVMPENVTPERTQGLRALDDGFIPPIIDLSLLDRKIFVTNRDAIVWTRRLLDEEGIFAGVSSGAIASIAVRIANELEEGNVGFVVCDDGWKYLSSGLYTLPVQEIENLYSTVWW